MEQVSSGYLRESTRRALIARLNRIEGQVRGVKRMIERQDPCEAILLQVASLRAAIAQVGRVLVEEHLRTCVVDAANGHQSETELRRLGVALDRLIR